MTSTKNTTATATITRLMHRVLKSVSKNGLSRKAIQEAEFGGNSVNLAVAIRPLAEMKLIKMVTVDIAGKEEELIEATAKGKKIAAQAPPMPATAAAHEALPKVGGFIEKTYLGKEYKVKVTADGFEFKGKKYASLTAAAKAVRGSDQEVNGWAFFGLVKAKAEANGAAK